MENLVNFFINAFSGLDKNVVVFLISMFPLLELRGGMIAAAVFKMPYLQAMVLCLLGNMLPMPFILLFITKIFDALKKTKLFKPMVQKIENKAMGKSDKIQKYEFLGILLFVGIPLPGTGAWTGALIASLLGIKLRKSIPAILCGIFLASAIMSCVTYLSPAIIPMIKSML